MPEIVKGRPRQGAPFTSTTSRAATEDFLCVAPRLEGVKFRLAARACRCGSDVAVIGAGLTVSCTECGVRRGYLSERTTHFLMQVCRQFGPPLEPVILRREATR
jgi:hypothetical protein